MSRQGVVHGVVDVNVMGSPTRYGPGDASAVAVSVVAPCAVGAASRVSAAANAATFPNMDGLLSELQRFAPSAMSGSGTRRRRRTAHTDAVALDGRASLFAIAEQLLRTRPLWIAGCAVVVSAALRRVAEVRRRPVHRYRKCPAKWGI
jgi:hypothetical protein